MVSLQTTFETGIPLPELKFIAKTTIVSFNELESLFIDMMYYIKNELIHELERWIRLHVPKRTGQLQDVMIDTLKYNSKVDFKTLTVELGAMVEYAEDVNDMKTGKVRHFGEWGVANYYGHKGLIFLMDPFAEGNFWDKYTQFAQDRLTTITQRAIDEYFKGTGTLMKMIRGRMF